MSVVIRNWNRLARQPLLILAHACMHVCSSHVFSKGRHHAPAHRTFKRDMGVRGQIYRLTAEILSNSDLLCSVPTWHDDLPHNGFPSYAFTVIIPRFSTCSFTIIFPYLEDPYT